MKRHLLFQNISGNFSRTESWDFDLPVLAVLACLGELLRQDPVTSDDGRMLHMSRILMVANAWCAMTAPRSWRAPMDEDAALNELRSDPDRYTETYVRILASALDFID